MDKFSNYLDELDILYVNYTSCDVTKYKNTHSLMTKFKQKFDELRIYLGEMGTILYGANPVLYPIFNKRVDTLNTIYNNGFIKLEVSESEILYSDLNC